MIQNSDMGFRNNTSTQNELSAFTVIGLDSSFADLIPVFVEESCKGLDSLSGALKAGDQQAIAKTLHRLKGSSSSYGCKAFLKILEDLEKQFIQDPKKVMTSDLFQIDVWKQSLRSISVADL